jgi:hypothetical protein
MSPPPSGLNSKPSKDPSMNQIAEISYYLLHAVFLLGLLFNPEDEGGTFFRNVCSLSTNHMALYPRRQNHSLCSLQVQRISIVRYEVLYISVFSDHAILFKLQNLTTIPFTCSTIV